MVLIIGALILSGIIGEIRFRKRYQSEHLPILESISELLDELIKDEAN